MNGSSLSDEDRDRISAALDALQYSSKRARMIDLHELIESLPKEQQEGALRVLDAISSPLTSRQVELALRRTPMPRSRAISLARGLEQFHIIAIVGPERG